MKKVYFDSNIYSEIIRRDIKSEQIRSILSEKKLQLIISSLNMFEIASCWKSGDPSDIEQGIKRFKLIKELLPCRFLNTIHNILLMEIDKAINNANISPFCENQGKADFEREINKLAQGIYDNNARTFIENRWAGKRNDIKRKTSELTENESIFKSADQFQEFFVKNDSLQQLIVEDLIYERVMKIPNRHRRKTAEKILCKSRKFPMIISVVKANLFLDFRALKFGNCSHDTLDDLKHLINASYTDVFVTGDNKLYNYSKEIDLYVEILTEDDFLNIKLHNNSMQRM